MLFIGPSLLSGIGQYLHKYLSLFPGSKYVQVFDEITECDEAFIFAIPDPYWIEKIPELKKKFKKLECMTICETETVHEDYGKLFTLFDRIAVPSEFCKRVLSRQFPDTVFYMIHAHIPRDDRYIFYHIGNVLDQRKNFKGILEAFIRLNEPNARLVVKATCKTDIKVNIPNVEIINGLISDEEMDNIHRRCDCYVSFSNSEGVGMGAIEAAIRDKPVIITEYGGASEYIKTPYTIDCTLQELANDDYLFKKGMLWGNPDATQLSQFMRDAFDKRLKYMDHTYTKNITSKESVLNEFFFNNIGCDKSDKTGEDSP